MRETRTFATHGVLATYGAYSIPQAELRRCEGIGRNLLDRLIRDGEIDSFILGQRARHVVVQSYLDYIARQMAGGIPRDPVEKARAVERYTASLAKSTGAKAAKIARAGWGLDHGKKGGSPHLTSRRAAPRQKVSPPAVAAPKSKTRGSRKETTAPAH